MKDNINDNNTNISLAPNARTMTNCLTELNLIYCIILKQIGKFAR